MQLYRICLRKLWDEFLVLQWPKCLRCRSMPVFKIIIIAGNKTATVNMHLSEHIIFFTLHLPHYHPRYTPLLWCTISNKATHCSQANRFRWRKISIFSRMSSPRGNGHRNPVTCCDSPFSQHVYMLYWSSAGGRANRPHTVNAPSTQSPLDTIRMAAKYRSMSN